MGTASHRRSVAASFIRYCVMAAVLAAILILVSGHADWLRAWGYALSLLVAQLGVGWRLARVSPELLVERQRVREGTKTWDKVLAPLFGIAGPLAMWCVAALDMRNHWPGPVPPPWSVAGFAACFAGLSITGWAMLANRFFAATVRIQTERGHVLVDTGPYRYVRHPGYVGAGLFTLASPLALGSWRAMIPAVLTFALLAVRTALEDRTLRNELSGYGDYARRVRCRLCPGVW